MSTKLVAFLCRWLLHKTRIVAYHQNIVHHEQEAADVIRTMLMRDAPCMIARYGYGEYRICMEAELIRAGLRRNFSDHMVRGLQNNAGFFPATRENLLRFATLMRADSRELDMLGVWNGVLEDYFKEMYASAAVTCALRDLEPYYVKNPWTAALQGKTVLVIHPFAESIRQQYGRHENLFANPAVLPDFELRTITAVQSIAGNRCPFSSWFEALDFMKEHISATSFDIAIIGCGAYGFPLAAHIKRLGKKAVHLGGATQILFGIKGKRWDDHPLISQLYNDYWIRPGAQEHVAGADSVESGCYW